MRERFLLCPSLRCVLIVEVEEFDPKGKFLLISSVLLKKVETKESGLKTELVMGSSNVGLRSVGP